MSIEKTKKKFYKKPWFWMIIGFFFIAAVIGSFLEEEETNYTPTSDPSPNEEVKDEKTDQVTKQPETNKKSEKEKQQDKSLSDTYTLGHYSKEEEQMLLEAYDWKIKDGNYLIKDIYPMDKGDYSIIHVIVDESIRGLSKDEKEQSINDWGPGIMNLTNINLGKDPDSEWPRVEFMYYDQSRLATPNILSGGWKIK